MTAVHTPPAVADLDPAAVCDLDAERVVLGILMTDPSAIDKIDGLTADAFYNHRHGQIFAAIVALHSNRNPTDIVAVCGFLADAGTIDRLGGANYLHDCQTSVPVTAMLSYYLNRIFTTAERRKLQEVGVRVAQAATAPGRDTADVVTLATELLQQVQAHRADPQMVQLGSLINPCLDDIETRKDRPLGITTGYGDLDKLIGGLRRKQLITVAGVTGAGKSVFLIDVARHVAIHGKLTVAFFSFEMDESEIFDRILSAEARVPHMAVRDGYLSEDDWSRISGKIGPMSNAPLFLAAEGRMTVTQIKTRCERLRARHGLDLVIVDHMHLLAPSQRCNDEQTRMANISRSLKQDLAVGLDVPVLAAAQLNRASGTRTDKRPQLTDLKHSSSIEQDSNMVVFVHREDYYDKESPRAGEADLIVDKNRSGPKDTITVAAQLHYSRFVDMAIV